jgi:16S rRNA (cytidine1402-2'-O)-methyltransferase
LAATLYLIATPIGNLEDITLRALRILREEVSLIACEDTRQTQKLLEHFAIRKPLLSYHDHNEAARSTELLERLSQGDSIALVSDAGTPLVSDPGYRLVTSAIQQGIPVVPIPGPSAALAALTASGLPVDEFRFVGFLPSKSGARRRFLEELAHEPGTIIAYESPHRILASLEDITATLGDRPIVVAREITKIHEEFLRGNALNILNQLKDRASIKGEVTLLIGRPSETAPADLDPLTEIERLQTEEGLDRMEAIKTVAKRLGLPKREVYRLSAGQDSNPPDKRRG